MSTDPTEGMRIRASEYDEVDEGTACTQSSFKVRKKSFLFAGPQGGRFKAMFKLKDSIPEAEELAAEQPDRFDVGKGWVTARFSSDEPMPEELWERWLDESYALAVGSSKKTATTKTAKKGAKKGVVKKKASKKKSAPKKKAATKKSATKKSVAKKAATKKTVAKKTTKKKTKKTAKTAPKKKTATKTTKRKVLVTTKKKTRKTKKTAKKKRS